MINNNLKIILAFDVFGALIDTKNISSNFDNIVRDLPNDFTKLWTNKIIEYGFRNGLMGGFSTHTESKINGLAKSIANDTAKNFLDDLIILEAKRHLQYTDLNINEIAYSLGFNDPYYFSRF